MNRFAWVFLLFCLPVMAQKPDILEVMDISGIINGSTASSVTEQVEKINENPKIKAVLLVVDTPGGGVSPSAAIYEELSKLKVPVVVWCMSVCASGGVYVAMAPTVKYIAVRDQTIGGSVGVIMQATRFNRLLDWAKIDNETYKSGKLKDAGNPTRSAEEDEKKYLQGIIDNLADRFYRLVHKARPKADMVDIKSAKIYIGDEIVKVGLADAVMTRQQITAKAKELSGSKTIFTRDELRKMSTAADSHTSYQAPTQPAFGDLPWIIETAKEIRGGTSVKFEYRMPYTF